MKFLPVLKTVVLISAAQKLLIRKNLTVWMKWLKCFVSFAKSKGVTPEEAKKNTAACQLFWNNAC